MKVLSLYLERVSPFFKRNTLTRKKKEGLGLLVALTKDGKSLSIANSNLTKEELIQLREQEQFYCPACHQEVIVKLGAKHAWHFAHKKKLTCTDEIENETAYHIAGKKHLYEWFKRQGLDVVLEPYLQDVKQRPDLLVTTSKKKYAIEFQCAKISTEIFLKRTNCYQNLLYTPIWILGGNQLKRQYSSIFRLSSFHWLFTYDFSPNYYSPQILSFCPENKKFLILKNLTAISANRSATTPLLMSPADFSLQLFFEPTKPFIHLEHWLKAKNKWRSHRMKLSRAELFLQKLYVQKGRALALFPSEAGFPVNHHHFIETPAYIWQSWIVEIFITSKKQGEIFHKNLVKRAFQTLVKKGIFQLRLLPFASDESYNLLAIDSYLQFLCQLTILNTKDGQYYEKMNDISLPKTITEAMTRDQQFLFHFCQR